MCFPDHGVVFDRAAQNVTSPGRTVPLLREAVVDGEAYIRGKARARRIGAEAALAGFLPP